MISREPHARFPAPNGVRSRQHPAKVTGRDSTPAERPGEGDEGDWAEKGLETGNCHSSETGSKKRAQSQPPAPAGFAGVHVAEHPVGAVLARSLVLISTLILTSKISIFHHFCEFSR